MNTTSYFKVTDMVNAISRLKKGKGDGDLGFLSDHLIHAPHRLKVILCLLFNSMLVHGTSPDNMLIGNMLPLPKPKKDRSNSDNYRAITLNIALNKLFDTIVLNKEKDNLITNDLQFGFKESISTTMCTATLKETVLWYNNKGSNVHALFLDASKAFDRVHFIKLFNKLLDRQLPPTLLRCLLFMYTKQVLQVKWSSKTSESFNVSNGVKQGSILSPTLFAVYMDDLLSLLSHSKVGCHVCSVFTGALCYADDITLLAPSGNGLSKLADICEQYARDFNISFNGDKSQLITFKCNNKKLDFIPSIYIANKTVNYCTHVIHLGHKFI